MVDYRWDNKSDYKERGYMKSIKTKEDFQNFVEDNRDKIYAKAEMADDISLNDEWMQENEWDEVYKKQHNNSPEDTNLTNS